MSIKLGTVLTAGMLSLVAHGGVAPYAFVAGDIGDSSASSGLTINADGSITGTASTIGHFQFVGEGQDSSSPDQVYQGTFEITIDHLLHWKQSTPPDGWRQENYYYVFMAQGGTTTTYSKISGTFPTGLALDGSTGELSGTIGATGNTTWNFVVRATDSTSGDFIDIPCTINVASELKPTISFATVSLNTGVAQTITKSTAGAAGGLEPLTAYPDSDFPFPTGLRYSFDQAGNITFIADQSFDTTVLKFDWRDSLGQTTVGQAIHVTANDSNQRQTLLDVSTGDPIVENPGRTYYQYDDGTPLDIHQDSAGDTHIVVERGGGGGDSGGPFAPTIYTRRDILTASSGNSLFTLDKMWISDPADEILIRREVGSSAPYSWSEVYPRQQTTEGISWTFDSAGIIGELSVVCSGGEVYEVWYRSEELPAITTLTGSITLAIWDATKFPTQVTRTSDTLATANTFDSSYTSFGATVAKSSGKWICQMRSSSNDAFMGFAAAEAHSPFVNSNYIGKASTVNGHSVSVETYNGQPRYTFEALNTNSIGSSTSQIAGNTWVTLLLNLDSSPQEFKVYIGDTLLTYITLPTGAAGLSWYPAASLLASSATMELNSGQSTITVPSPEVANGYNAFWG